MVTYVCVSFAHRSLIFLLLVAYFNLLLHKLHIYFTYFLDFMNQLIISKTLKNWTYSWWWAVSPLKHWGKSLIGHLWNSVGFSLTISRWQPRSYLSICPSVFYAEKDGVGTQKILLCRNLSDCPAYLTAQKWWPVHSPLSQKLKNKHHLPNDWSWFRSTMGLYKLQSQSTS
jgi:hypothetical protein